MRNRIGCVGCAVLLLAVVACTGDDDERTREKCADVGASCGTVPSSSSSTSTSSTTSPTTTSTVAPTAPSTSAPDAPITRPIIDPTKCTPLATRENPVSAVDLDLFARPNRLPSTIQIIAGPASGPAGPFALIQRYSDQAGGVGDTEAIGQWQAAVRAYSNGNGEATWNLADGTQGYLRSRGLDREELVRIIRDLTPRDAAAAVPGFDYTPQGDEGALSLQAEHVSTGVHGGGAASACQVQSNTHLYRVAVLFGDPVYQYALVIDRPVPLEVGFGDGGALIVIGGLADASAPTVSDVVNADPDQWERLLTQPMP